MTHLNAAL